MVRRLALLAVGASALVAPVAPGARRTAMKAADAQLEGMIGRSIECGDQIWDPLELSQWRDAGEMRACELANGRAAMLGWVGWLWPQVFGLWKGGAVTTTDPIDAIMQVPRRRQNHSSRGDGVPVGLYLLPRGRHRRDRRGDGVPKSLAYSLRSLRARN